MTNDNYSQVFRDLGIQIQPLPSNYTPEDFGRRLLSMSQTEHGIPTTEGAFGSETNREDLIKESERAIRDDTAPSRGYACQNQGREEAKPLVKIEDRLEGFQIPKMRIGNYFCFKGSKGALEKAYASNTQNEYLKRNKFQVPKMGTGYDIFSQNGYLMDISEAFSQVEPDLLNRLAPYITSNEIILSDNSIDVALGESAERIYESTPSKNGVIVSDLPIFQDAGFSDDVFIGIIANTPRIQIAKKYFEYIIP